MRIGIFEVLRFELNFHIGRCSESNWLKFFAHLFEGVCEWYQRLELKLFVGIQGFPGFVGIFGGWQWFSQL